MVPCLPMAEGGPKSGLGSKGTGTLVGLDSTGQFGPAGQIGAAGRFLGLTGSGDDTVEAADVVLFGVPHDAGTVGRLGAREGPSHVRRQSWTFGGYNPALGLDILEDVQIVDGGDLDAGGTEQPDVLLKLVQARTFGLARSGQIPGMIGGTGLLTLGALRGIVQAKRRPITLLHLTARHSLRRDSLTEIGMLAVAQEEGLLKKGGVLQVGVRGPYRDGDEVQDALRAGFERLSVDNVRWDIHAAMESIRNITEGHTVYVSVDLSCLDPSVCPGVTRPIPGGLSSWEVQQVLRSLVGADVVGFDVVGSCPACDSSDLTSIMAVGVLHEVLSVVAESRDSSRFSLLGGRSGRTSA